MTTIYFVLSACLLVALAFPARLFLAHGKSYTRDFCLIAVCFSSVALALYFYTSNQAGLLWWESQGKAHYQLLSQVDNLGGIAGMIEKVEARIQVHPDDPQGWLILGKLYLAKANKTEASAAFTKAKSLAPDDAEIDRYYHKTLLLR